MLTATNQPRDTQIATAILVAVLIVVSVAVPFAVLIGAPVLLLIGIRTLRRPADPAARTVGWVAVASGLLLLVLMLLFVLGLMAAGTTGVMSEAAPIQQLQP